MNADRRSKECSVVDDGIVAIVGVDACRLGAQRSLVDEIEIAGHAEYPVPVSVDRAIPHDVDAVVAAGFHIIREVANDDAVATGAFGNEPAIDQERFIAVHACAIDRAGGRRDKHIRIDDPDITRYCGVDGGYGVVGGNVNGHGRTPLLVVQFHRLEKRAYARRRAKQRLIAKAKAGTEIRCLLIRSRYVILNRDCRTLLARQVPA